jgi:hypothetical protein
VHPGKQDKAEVQVLGILPSSLSYTKNQLNSPYATLLAPYDMEELIALISDSNP